MNFLFGDPKKLHFSIDIETLATTENAAITEIGGMVLENLGYQADHKFHRYVIPNNGYSDPKTIQWRLDNNLPWEHENAITISPALVEFFRWIKDCCVYKPGAVPIIWCKGTDFDPKILEYHAVNWGMTDQIPWKYNHTRDIRTLLQLFPEFVIPKEQVVHNGLADAMEQGERIIKIAEKFDRMRSCYKDYSGMD